MPIQTACATPCSDPRRAANGPLRAAVPVRDDTESADAEASDDFRQLRHLTKNALQRILAIISEAPELDGIQAGRSLGEDLQRRILAAAKLSDALFGLVNQPGRLRDRLLEMSGGLIDLLADDAATIKVTVTGHCSPSAGHDDLLVRVAHELVGNAIKHGMHQRLLGEIQIDLLEDAGGITLTVADDGWGPARENVSGQGLSIVDALLRVVDGSYGLRRVGRRTVAEVGIPCGPPRIVRRQHAS